MRLLITGGAGFIGSNLALAAQRANPHWRITVLDNLFSGSVDNLAGFRGKVVIGDLRDENLLRSLVKNSDAVVHLAAVGSVPRSIASPSTTFSNNVEGTERLLECVRDSAGKKVVFASSSSVYGGNPKNPKAETDFLSPLSPYAASKVAGEALMAGYAAVYDFDPVVFRFFNVYGPRQNPQGTYAAVVPKFLRAALRDEEITIHGDGTQTRDFTHIDSVTQVLLASLDGIQGFQGPLNLAFGSETSISSLAETVSLVIGKKVRLKYAQGRVGDARVSRSDPTEFSRRFPGLVGIPLKEGLEITASWIRKNQMELSS